MNLGGVFGSVWPLYSQVNFWITLLLTMLVWYGVAVGLAHALFGAGRRTPVDAAKQGMSLSLLLLFVALACGAYFLFRPADLVYMISICVTFLLLTLIVSAVFSRMGVER
ncbi:hypothetical protein GCM10008956_37060 [Deinococcus arenae]|uniref:Uncharacterized protein n=1 Tax=Deinococcus arenae TaxID=1452751 RepID=A0A8H9GTB8_9DEIO|nr:hypothetical protein [Deinococcus arenae]GGM58073.1 hypothetical protein GCM10008956_37060 [Deinococcus arenae]